MNAAATRDPGGASSEERAAQHGDPVLIRGGELGNSSAKRAFLSPYWPKFQAMGLNAIVAPIYRDVVERFTRSRTSTGAPLEGKHSL